MYRDNAYEIKMNSTTFDIISANTAFYAFVGSRLYTSFDKLIEPSKAAFLKEYIEEGHPVILPLRTEDGSYENTLAMFAVRQDEELVGVKMIVLDEIEEWEWNLKNQVTKKNAILRLYGDYYFEYDVRMDNLRIYAADRFEQTIMSVSLSDFEKKLFERADEKNRNDINNLIKFLREGSERFVVNLAGDILNLRETAYTLMKGASVYEEGVYVYTTGYIHFWSERSTDSSESKPALERDYLTGVLTKGEITKLAISTVDEKKTQNITMAIAEKKDTKASSHYIIGLSGEIIQCVPLEEVSYASNERNWDTISIECCIDNEHGKFNEKTYDALIELTAWLVGEYDLKIDDVIRHYDVTGKSCPKYFVEHESAWEDFKLDLEKYIEENGVKK